MRKVQFAVSYHLGLIFNKFGFAPALHTAEGCVNSDWIHWWCGQHDASFMKGKQAWVIAEKKFEEPPFKDPGWFLWFVNDSGAPSLEAVEAERKALLVRQGMNTEVPVPPLLLNHNLINVEWRTWYEIKHCCGRDKALLAAQKACVRLGVIPVGSASQYSFDTPPHLTYVRR